MRTRLVLALGLALSGCGIAPPPGADQAKFAADLKSCEEAGDKEAHRRVMARGLLFMTYPVSLPILERRQRSECMARKGYPT
jgi:hypothetical protein